MPEIKMIVEQPIVNRTDSFLGTDFRIYVAPLNTKRFSDHLKLKHHNEDNVLSHITHRCASVKSNVNPPSIKRKVKEAYHSHSISHFLSRISKNALETKPSALNNHKLEKMVLELKENLDRTSNLHVSINESIRKNRQTFNQRASDIELGYLARLVMNKIYKIPLDAEVSKSKQLKTMDEIQDIFDIIKEYLQEDIDVYSSMEHSETFRGKKVLAKMQEQIDALSVAQNALLDEIYHLSHIKIDHNAMEAHTNAQLK